jgi:predicted ATPase
VNANEARERGATTPPLLSQRERGLGGEGLFPDGVWFVNLAPIADPGLVATTIAHVLNVPESASKSIEESLRAFLREKRTLLLLDNFEHLLGAAPLVAELLVAAPGLKVLATSRAALHLRGEKEFAVAQLAVPPQEPRTKNRKFDRAGRDTVLSAELSLLSSAAELSQYAAVQLFVARAQDARRDFAVTNANAPAVAEICYRLDGLPLAIELAAARVKLFAPEALLTRLDNQLKLLTGGARDLPSRQQTIRGAIDWSYQLLDDGERMLFARLGVFVGGCTLEAAEAVCNAKGDLRLDIVDGLAALVDKSLLKQVDGMDGEPRFTMLETIREYARERLAASGELDVARHQHAAYYLTFAARAESALIGPQQPIWLDLLDADHNNLRAALEWGQAGDGADIRLRLAGSLWRFWFLRGYFTEGQQWLERALGQSSGPPAAQAKALAGVAFLAIFRGNSVQGMLSCTESLRLARQAGDQRLVAFSLSLLGDGYCQTTEFVRATAALEESLALARQVGDRWLIAFSLVLLAEVAHLQNDFVQVAPLAEESLALARQVGDRWLIALALFQLGNAATAKHDYTRARALHEEGLVISRELGDRLGMAIALLGLANTASAQGDTTRAWAYTEERLAIERELNNQEGIAHVLNDMGYIAYEQADYAGAKARFTESLALCRELGFHWCVAFQLMSLARVALAQPDYAQARAWLNESLTLCQAQALEGYIRPLVLLTLGRVACYEGDYASGWAHYIESLAGYQEIGNREGIAHNLVALGGLAAMQAQPVRAARLWGAAEELHDRDRVHLDRLERRDHNAAVAAARAQLDESTFSAAWAAGRTMTLEQAIAYALSEDDRGTERA